MNPATNRKPRSTGFTLVEMLVVIALLAVLVSSLSGALNSVGRSNHGCIEPSEGIKQGAMAARIEQAALVMLTVDLDQRRPDLAQQRRRHRLVVDISAAAAVRLDGAADEERLAGLERDVIAGKQGREG